MQYEFWGLSLPQRETKVTAEQLATIFRMKAAGSTHRNIAKTVGFSTPYITNTINHLNDPIWREKELRKAREIARKRYAADPEGTRAYARKRYLVEKPLRRKWEKRTRQKIKDEVFAHYGGYLCKCCGETIRDFLQIDHIDGGGNKQRKELKLSGVRFYNWLKRNSFPPGYQVLCANCNWGRRFIGTCPHNLPHL